MGIISIDTHKRIDIYKYMDGAKRLQASVLKRTGYAYELRIPQEGHSKVDGDGNFSTFLTADVLEEIGNSVSLKDC